MDNTLAIELAKISVLAPVVAGLIWFIVLQHKHLREIEEHRAKDMEGVIDRLLALTERWNQTLSAMIASAEAQKEAIRGIRETLREVNNEYRKRD